MIPWRKMETYPKNREEEVWLTNGRNVTKARYNKKLQKWAYGSVLMWDTTHWCKIEDFEIVFPKKGE